MTKEQLEQLLPLLEGASVVVVLRPEFGGTGFLGKLMKHRIDGLWEAFGKNPAPGTQEAASMYFSLDMIGSIIENKVTSGPAIVRSNPGLIVPNFSGGR